MKKKQDFELRQMKKNSKLGLTERRLQAQKMLDKKYGDTGDVW